MSERRLDALRDELLADALDEERDGLATAHDRLVTAGPLPELPPGLLEAPEPPAATGALRMRRYRFTAIAAAAAIAIAVFGAGWLLGGGRAPEAPVQTVVLAGVGEAVGASADLDLFAKDAAGNWPMEITVRGLEELPDEETYELWLTRAGELAEQCGSFVVSGGETSVRLNAPYALEAFDGWVVTTPDEQVVLRTAGAA